MKAVYEKVSTDASRFFLVKRRADPCFEFLWHYHPELELTLITRSRGRRLVGDHIEDYQDGDLVLLGPNLPHTWCSFPTPPSVRHEAVVVQFGADLLAGLDGRKLGPVRDLFRRCERGLRFDGATRDEVAARMVELHRQSPLTQLAELLLILDRLSRSDDGHLLSSRTLAPQPQPDGAHPIDKVCKFINERYVGRVPLAQAARVAGMSESAFSRFFHRTTGRTYTDYVNELRLGHACRLLIETERGIADIAGAAGFSNLSYFNRYFLRSKKVPPTRFRKEYRRHHAPS
jgi:AraC-like DNA-binding protein